MGKHTKYNMPSGHIEFDLNNIEPSLRRAKKDKEPSLFVLILLGLVVATLGYFVVSMVVEDQAQAAEVSQEVTRSLLCDQYLKDTSLDGTAAEETLNSICN